MKKYEKIAREIRKTILLLHSKANTSHIASSLSCVDLLVGLYFGDILKINKNNLSDANRDRFILSKGHAVSALYSSLYKKGFFDKNLLSSYCRNGGILPGHSTRNTAIGVEVTTGALGHGLSIGAGMALVGKKENRKYRVFILMSDGECQEGSVWEAAMFAAHHKLDNIIVIVDYNKIQAFGNTKEIVNLEPFIYKWESFGFAVKEIDGHNFREIISILKKVPFKKNKPSVVIAHTIKGKGISFMENKLEWHYKSPTKEDLEMAIREL